MVNSLNSISLSSNDSLDRFEGVASLEQINSFLRNKPYQIKEFTPVEDSSLYHISLSHMDTTTVGFKQLMQRLNTDPKRSSEEAHIAIPYQPEDISSVSQFRVKYISIEQGTIYFHLLTEEFPS
jgi:hypothetical protein